MWSVVLPPVKLGKAQLKRSCAPPVPRDTSRPRGLRGSTGRGQESWPLGRTWSASWGSVRSQTCEWALEIGALNGLEKWKRGDFCSSGESKPESLKDERPVLPEEEGKGPKAVELLWAPAGCAGGR